MKIKTTINIYFCKFAWEEVGKFVPFAFPVEPCENYTYVSQQEIELEVPDNYDPRAQQIAALEAQKQKVMADYQKSVTDINDRISKLQALEYTA
jgi:hypothetical protein